MLKKAAVSQCRRPSPYDVVDKARATARNLNNDGEVYTARWLIKTPTSASVRSLKNTRCRNHWKSARAQRDYRSGARGIHRARVRRPKCATWPNALASTAKRSARSPVSSGSHRTPPLRKLKLRMRTRRMAHGARTLRCWRWRKSSLAQCTHAGRPPSQRGARSPARARRTPSCRYCISWRAFRPAHASAAVLIQFCTRATV